MMEASNKRLVGAANQAVRQRNYRRARDRALVRLAHLYPDTYKQLLEMEKKTDEQEGKTWLDLSGNTVPVVGVRIQTAEGRGAPATKGNSNRSTDEGNNGGEA
jgi:predicted RNase H-like nuclease (RuvC/YqgF family)